jgi:hypothetical protein
MPGLVETGINKDLGIIEEHRSNAQRGMNHTSKSAKELGRKSLFRGGSA